MTAENVADGRRRRPGMLVELPPAPGTSGTRAVAVLADRMRRSDAELSAGRRVDFGGAAGLHWLIEQYLFSRDAGHHVTPVLCHEMSAAERELWTWATLPETWHLPLYRLVFSQLSISFAEVDALRPTESTCRYLRALRAAAERGPVCCAAAMMVVEKRPARLGAPADRCWADLAGQGPFRPDAILSLWQQHPAAESSPYQTIGEVVVANRQVVDDAELGAALTSLDRVAAAGRAWLGDVLAERPRRSG